MQIDITVVMTEILNGKLNPEPLEEIKNELIREYGRMYILGPNKGYWKHEGIMYEDISEIWRIFTEKEDCKSNIEAYAKRIGTATAQITQLYTISDETQSIEPHFI
jgi:hypothetical protein